MKKAETQEQEFLEVCSSYDHDLLTGKKEMTLKDYILITFLSMIVSAGLSITFADKIGAYIIQKAGESTTDLTISIATSDMVMVYSIGLALVCFSVLVASYTVIRLNPKDILSKMD